MTRNVGIDLGQKGVHRGAILDGSKPRGRTFTVRVSRGGFEELLRRAEKGAQGTVRFVMEPTGVAWIPLSAFLMDAGHEVYVVKTQKAHDLRKFLRKHAKSDTIDAITLGKIPEVDPDGIYPVFLPGAEISRLKRLVKQRARIVDQIEKQKKRILALVDLPIPNLASALGADKFTQVARTFMARYADPTKAVKKGRRGLTRFWEEKSAGRADPDRADRVYEVCSEAVELYKDLRKKGKIPFDYEAVQRELREELKELKHLETRVKELDARIEPLARKIDPEKILEGIPGIGKVIAAAILGIVGGSVARFANGTRFVGFCGLCPRKEQSGQMDKSMPITKAGHRLLKKYLYLAADVARQYDPQFAAYYARRYRQGYHHNRILIALARKMAWRVYGVLKRRENAASNSGNKKKPRRIAFELRDPTGKSIEPKAARELICKRYSREAAEPQRCASDRRKRERGKQGKSPTMSGRQRRHNRTIAPTSH